MGHGPGAAPRGGAAGRAPSASRALDGPRLVNTSLGRKLPQESYIPVSGVAVDAMLWTLSLWSRSHLDLTGTPTLTTKGKAQVSKG